MFIDDHDYVHCHQPLRVQLCGGAGKGKDGKGSKASVRASPYETSILAANAGLAAVAGMPALGGLAAFNPQMSVFGGQLAGETLAKWCQIKQTRKQKI